MPARSADPPITIRDARDDDSWDLIGLIAACWAEYPGCILDVHGEEPWLLRPASAYQDEGGRLWVAEMDGRVVASVALRPGAEPGLIALKSLYVARAARRRGLGAQLVALVEESARRRNAAAIELWTDTRFDDAHRLYERLGYRRGPHTRTLADLSRSVEYYYMKAMSDDSLTVHRSFQPDAAPLSVPAVSSARRAPPDPPAAHR